MSKIKSKVVKETLANKDVLDMFQGIMGTSEGTAALAITVPKYKLMAGHAERFIRLVTALDESVLMSIWPDMRANTGAFLADLRLQLAESLPACPAGPYTSWAKEDVDFFNSKYAGAKGCGVINTVVLTCKELLPYKKYLQDPAALSDRFILKGAGTTIAPIAGLALNFKQVYIDDRNSPGDRTFLLLVMHKLFTIGHDMYEAVSSPDVDMEEFVEVIMSSIEEVKKHIPRCDQAFNKIIESVSLLKGNFSGYYKDFVASNNPSIIMENFVLDVSKGTKSSPTVTAQFRRIISHYRKMADQQASHPKLQSLFQQVDKNFKELERQDSIAEVDIPDSDEEAAGPATGPATGPAAVSAKNQARNRKKKAAAARAKAARVATAEDSDEAEDAAEDTAEGKAEGKAEAEVEGKAEVEDKDEGKAKAD